VPPSHQLSPIAHPFRINTILRKVVANLPPGPQSNRARWKSNNFLLLKYVLIFIILFLDRFEDDILSRRVVIPSLHSAGNDKTFLLE
jgi:hypothetical protein